jgi:hypothetical protein
LFGELIDRENRIRQDWFGHGKKRGDARRVDLCRDAYGVYTIGKK